MTSMWEDDSIQFARLIGEMAANINLTPEQEECLCESMDLTPARLNELFSRAQTRWDRIKANTTVEGYCPPFEDGYNDDMDPASQLDDEERISALIFDTCGEALEDDDSGVPAEATCNALGRQILEMVLQKYRPDLFERELKP